jgi:hypothetical protein
MQNDWFRWIDDHFREWWQDIIDIITNESHRSTRSQTEIALLVVTLFIVLITNIVIAVGMIRRGPVLLLDKALLTREVVFGILWGITLWSFYTLNTIPTYLRISVYIAIALSGIFINIALARESTMTPEEVEEERLLMLERKHFDEDTRQGQT